MMRDRTLFTPYTPKREQWCAWPTLVRYRVLWCAEFGGDDEKTIEL